MITDILDTLILITLTLSTLVVFCLALLLIYFIGLYFYIEYQPYFSVVIGIALMYLGYKGSD